MALVDKVKRTGTITQLSIYQTNGGMQKKRGGKYGCGTEGEKSYGRKGSKSSGGRNSLRADAPEHLCNETPVLTLRASFESQQLPALSISVQVDESGHRDSFWSQREVGSRGDVGSS